MDLIKKNYIKNMVDARADWLYELPQWEKIFDENTRKRLYKEQKNSGTIRKEKKIGRNDPCPCGSGKKYKKVLRKKCISERVFLDFGKSVCVVLFNTCHLFPQTAIDLCGFLVVDRRRTSVFGCVPLPAYVESVFGWICLGLWILFLTVEIKICRGMFSKPERGAQWIIILGAQVRGRKITDSLKRRLDAAIHYLEENERTMVVVSGGRGPGEDISEADAMEQYLIEQGVAENRIRKEDQSVSTRENLSFSRRFIDPKHETVGIVTNNFHSYRAKLLAEQEGYAHVFSVSASSNYVFQINYLVREFFAVLAIFLKNKRIL